MKTGSAAPAWIIAFVALGAMLVFLREMLAPFALALMLWIAIDGIAGYIREHIPAIPRWLAVVAALALVTGAIGFILYALAQQIGQILADAPALQARLDTLAGEAQHALRFGGPRWTVTRMLGNLGPAELLADIAGVLNSVGGQTTMVMIYVLFLFPAGASFTRKLPIMASGRNARHQLHAVLTAVQISTQRYLLVQTLISIVIAALSFATLTLLQMPNALFWCLLMFFLNYIPTVGSIVAVALPTLFALIAVADWRYAALVAVGLHVWQFGIGTFVQPRMTGGSLNLSTLVVVLSLAFWGTLWGLPGVFLAAPLTVVLMIILAQFSATRWIAVLLSANGQPAITLAAGSEAAPAGAVRSLAD